VLNVKLGYTISCKMNSNELFETLKTNDRLVDINFKLCDHPGNWAFRGDVINKVIIEGIKLQKFLFQFLQMHLEIVDRKK